jgi:formamidopyrimidine-DNA glycosylase
MPELPEVEAIRRPLVPAMTRKWFERVLVRGPDLRTPCPAGFGARITGTTARAALRRAKYLLASLSSGETLVARLDDRFWHPLLLKCGRGVCR